MKVFINKDETYPTYGITDISSFGYNPEVRMTERKYIWCISILRKFEKVQKYLEKRYEDGQNVASI